MHTYFVRHLAAAFGAASLVGLAGCGSDTTATEPTASPVTVGPVATPGGVMGGGVTSSGRTPLPSDSAADARDDLLGLADAADAGDVAAAGGHLDTAILTEWLTAYPDLALTVFADVPADARTVSASSAFLITPEVGSGDQWWGFAVADTAGGCAGAVAIIDGNADGTVRDADEVSTWVALDDLLTCSASGAYEAYAG